MDPSHLWRFIVPGYLLTILIEGAILFILLSRPHPPARRLFAGAWLTACTYPIVVLVLPLAMRTQPRWAYLTVAEIFAPLAECLIFAAAFHRGRAMPAGARARDFAAVVLANLASFAAGELALRRGWFFAS